MTTRALSVLALLGLVGCFDSRTEVDENGDGVCDYAVKTTLTDTVSYDEDCDGIYEVEDCGRVVGGHWECTVDGNVITDDMVEDNDGDGFIGVNDCDDTDPTIYPGAAETWYDGIDSDCDGANDFNQDGDGFVLAVDCNDMNADVHPGAVDAWYDGVDSDCDGADDFDADGDGYDAGTDCDDLNAAVNPGETEIFYNGIDDDCDGSTIDDDADGDGYDYDVDCNDLDVTINQGAFEICNDLLDNDCDGNTDLADTDCTMPAVDVDGDGYTSAVDCNDVDAAIHPGAVDIPDDGVDQDCDGVDTSLGTGCETQCATWGGGSPSQAGSSDCRVRLSDGCFLYGAGPCSAIASTYGTVVDWALAVANRSDVVDVTDIDWCIAP